MWENPIICNNGLNSLCSTLDITPPIQPCVYLKMHGSQQVISQRAKCRCSGYMTWTAQELGKSTHLFMPSVVPSHLCPEYKSNKGSKRCQGFLERYILLGLGRLLRPGEWLYIGHHRSSPDPNGNVKLCQKAMRSSMMAPRRSASEVQPSTSTSSKIEANTLPA